ncbi:MAG: CPBP family intramembrane glutamic endopeptidase [Pyrobaculum sp.]
MIRLFVVAAFITAVFLIGVVRPPICTGLYIGTVVYALFLPAGLLAKWRLAKTFPIAFLVYFAALIAAGAVAVAAPSIRAEYQALQERQLKFFMEAAQCPGGGPILAVQALALAPLVEEVVFRGLMFEEARRRLGVAAAYLISSLLFSLLHSPGLGAVPIFIIALSLAYAYHKHGLPASVAIHFFQNAVALYLAKVS